MVIIKEFLKSFQINKAQIALQNEITSLTYYELDNISNYIASYIDEFHGKSQRIGIEFEKSIDYIIALISVMKTKKTFVPMDKRLPQERLSYIKTAANVGFVLNKDILDMILEQYKNDTKYVYTIKEDIAPDSLAYIIFTSGSTGIPKGVKVAHRGLYNIIKQQVTLFELSTQSKFLLTNSISFDASLSDIFTSLLSGATLVIIEKNSNLLADINNFFITHLDISPSVINTLYKELPLYDLKVIVVGGEILSKSAHKFLCDKVKLINAYGPTETTICTSMRVLTKNDATNCIGTPIDGVRYIIENEELIIESPACADGYINDKSELFFSKDGKRYYKTGDIVQCRDGVYYFLGRKDRQVKVKGYRIELDEVESIIKKNSNVDILAVVYKDGQLVCFSLDVIDKDKLISLPFYMKPSIFKVLKKFQYTSSGKIDYEFLEKEIKYYTINGITDIFERVFQNKISEEDTWSTLGGDSLTLISIIALSEEAGFNISIEDVLSDKAIKELNEIYKDTRSLSTKYLKSTVTPIKCINEYHKHDENENVLFTGATGFLGAHMLEALLKTDIDEKYYCLIRSESIEKAKAKLKSSFTRFGLDISGLDSNRVHIIIGDITKDNIGLDYEVYGRLKKDITKIIHSAALVNSILSYNKIFDTNVKGTLEIIKLQKPIHYISTLSVFVSTDKNKGTVYEDDDLSDINVVYGGYAQSKFISEYLVRESDLPYVNYRLGLLTGHTNKDYFNSKEFLYMFLEGVKELKVLPKIDLEEFIVDISPIDFVVDTIKEIYIKANFRENKTFHIANKTGASLKLIYDVLKENHYDIQLLEPTKFREKLLSNDMDAVSKSMLFTLCRFDNDLYNKYRHMDLFQRTDIEFNMENTLEMASNIKFPKENKELIAKYLAAKSSMS